MKNVSRAPKRKTGNRVTTTHQQALKRNKALKAVIAKALEECWDGQLPFTTLEKALVGQ